MKLVCYEKDGVKRYAVFYYKTLVCYGLMSISKLINVPTATLENLPLGQYKVVCIAEI